MRYLPQLLSEAAVLRPPSPCSSVSTVSILGEELSTVSVTPIATPSASKNEESRASSPGTREHLMTLVDHKATIMPSAITRGVV